ncbi:type B 50S ribosomal protein L31 [Jonesia quinghaiensis]|uniref:type B 50S ribosomal protein L31 n=1 Tax=Jonesia quinghaiensis TaxID=262806 RepID=UPI0003F54500|nr:type B 50S ribosomal protein L31 [Jonesia quinghaiensis]
MKKNIHPDYHPVVFRDKAGGLTFLTRSTITSNETIEYNGQTYPLVDIDISSASHPFWTGNARVLDAEGRVERFRRRYGQSSDATSAPEGAAPQDGTGATA